MDWLLSAVADPEELHAPRNNEKDKNVMANTDFFIVPPETTLILFINPLVFITITVCSYTVFQDDHPAAVCIFRQQASMQISASSIQCLYMTNKPSDQPQKKGETGHEENTL